MTISTFLMLAVVLGGGAYLILSRHFHEILMGVGLLSNGINLLLIESSQSFAEGVDPLPQALILTAIVIGFGLISFLAAYLLKRFQQTGSALATSVDEESL